MTYTADGTGLMYGAEGTRSRVVRVDVEKRDGEGDGGKEPEGTKSPGAGDADGAGGGGDGKPTGTVGLVVVGAVVLVWLGLRKGRRGAK